MTPDELDRILATDDDIVPASRFAASIIDRVQREASAPPPVPFPWGRLVAGIVVLISLALWLAWSGVVEPLWRPLVSMPVEAWSATLAQAMAVAGRSGAAWTIAALIAALVSSRLGMRLAWPRP